MKPLATWGSDLHFRCCDVRGILVPDKDFDDYFKFSFVRNPWARVVSMYLYLLNDGWFLPDNSVDFRTWLQGLETGASVAVYPKCAPQFVRPQCDYFMDVNGDVMVNFVGFFENLQDDWLKMCEFAGIPDKFRVLPVVNSTKKKKHYTDYYDDESIERVRRLYVRDVEFGGYEFER
jgi:hypothetical protein